MNAPRAKHPDECPACEGFGYTNATATEWHEDATGAYHTDALGSGCPRCGGTGRTEPKT